MEDTGGILGENRKRERLDTLHHYMPDIQIGGSNTE